MHGHQTLKQSGKRIVWLVPEMKGEMKQDKVSFCLKVDRGYKEGGFSFPACQAELTTDLVDRLKMSRSLRRLAKALTLQLRKRAKRVRGVIISSVNFQMMFQDKEKPSCPKKP